MEDPTRPVTTGAAPGEGRRPGVKSELASLRNRVREHDLIIEDMKRKEETSESTGTEMLDNLQSMFETQIQQLRAEFDRKLAAANSEIAKLQKQIVIMRGDSSIQGQQLKVTSKNLGDLADTVDEIVRDIHGDNDDVYA
jgi:hypothetical protein